MRGGLTVLLLVVMSAQGDRDRHYYCRFGGDHTMCLYQGVAIKCFPRLSGGVKAAAQSAILNSLNSFRQRVAEGRETRGRPGPQPPAANMRKMEWSSELAMIAQRWSDQCEFKKDSCRSIALFTTVGQSVYMQSSPTNGTIPPPEWCFVISAWYNQVQDFNKASLCPHTSGAAEDYSQLVWADSYLVGCGYTVFRTIEDPSCTLQLYVCNYGPGGNIAGRSVYKKGRSCTRCPRGTRCTCPEYPALCV